MRIIFTHIGVPNTFDSIVIHGQRLPREYGQEKKEVLKLASQAE